MNLCTRKGTLTISLERDGQKFTQEIATRALGEWHIHRTLLPNGEQEDKYWTISHQCGVAAALGVSRRQAQNLLYRLADIPACPVEPAVARQMISNPAMATPEFREWYSAVTTEVVAWRPRKQR